MAALFGMITVGLVSAGCTTQTPTTPAPSVPAGPNATVAPAGQAPAPTGATSPDQPDVIANIPTAARMRTGPGAEAFVRYFFDIANEEGANPRGGRIFLLSTSTCKSCAELNKIVDELMLWGHHFAGPQNDVTAVNGMDGFPETDSSYRVAVRAVDSAHPIVDTAGKLVQQLKSVDSTYVLYLRWTATGWRVSKITVLETTEKS